MVATAGQWHSSSAVLVKGRASPAFPSPVLARAKVRSCRNRALSGTSRKGSAGASSGSVVGSGWGAPLSCVEPQTGTDARGRGEDSIVFWGCPCPQKLLILATRGMKEARG